MKKFKYSVLIIIFFLAITLGLSFVLKTHFSSTKKLNVIWISLDTQRAKSLDLYGYPQTTSPFLTNFAQNNIVFEHVWAQSSVTNLSHFSMLTGTYPVKHGILSIDPNLRLPSNIKMVSEFFKENGYQTLIAGSFRDNPFLNLSVGLGRGADISYIDDPIRYPYSSQVALETIKQFVLNKKPFFAFLHTWMVHTPYFPSKECLAPYTFDYKGKIIWDESTLKKEVAGDKRTPNFVDPTSPIALAFIEKINLKDKNDLKMLEALYNGAIRCQDQRLEIFFDELKKIIPDFDNTVIIITADHGESLGEHEVLQHGNMYQNDLWVPLIIHFPGQKAVRVKTPIRSIDILPSLLDFIDIKIPKYIDGKSFISLLSNPNQQKHFDIAFAQKEARYAVFQDEYKYIQRGGRELLFNIQKDPDELNNIAEENPELVFKLRNELLLYLLQKNDVKGN